MSGCPAPLRCTFRYLLAKLRGDQRRILSQYQGGGKKNLNNKIPRIWIDPTICRVYSGMCMTLRHGWSRLYTLYLLYYIYKSSIHSTKLTHKFLVKTHLKTVFFIFIHQKYPYAFSVFILNYNMNFDAKYESSIYKYSYKLLKFTFIRVVMWVLYSCRYIIDF